MEPYKCSTPGCDKEGILSVRGRPKSKYCEEHYRIIVKKLVVIGKAMRRIERRNEADDNQPARQPADIQ